MIKHNPTTAACPVSDIIDEDTFEYKLNNTGAMDQIGGFHWNLMVGPESTVLLFLRIQFHCLSFSIWSKSLTGTQFLRGNGENISI